MLFNKNISKDARKKVIEAFLQDRDNEIEEENDKYELAKTINK